jgi:hypothetical protein
MTHEPFPRTNAPSLWTAALKSFCWIAFSRQGTGAVTMNDCYDSWLMPAFLHGVCRLGMRSRHFGTYYVAEKTRKLFLNSLGE